jgi:hypothetical protein
LNHGKENAPGTVYAELGMHKNSFWSKTLKT